MRFCPSTGTPHVGISAPPCSTGRKHATRTALSCSVSRTPTRSVIARKATTRFDALKWLHTDWDEGIEVGGPDGPYRQSERTQIYKDVAAKLLEPGTPRIVSTLKEIEAYVAAGRPGFWPWVSTAI